MRGLNNIPGLLNRNNKTEKVGNFVINDIELHVPPTAISGTLKKAYIIL